MKHINFAMRAGLALAIFAAAPAQAEQVSSGLGPAGAGSDFLDAVKKSDGDKAMDLLASNPVGLVNVRGTDGNTGLIVAITRRDEQWTGFLLNKGADPNLAGKGGDTPMIAAARAGFGEALPWLIGLGAKVDATNRAGETPLIIAVQQRNTSMVEFLLKAGANPDKTDNTQGYSARQYAQRDPRARDILTLIENNPKRPKPEKTDKLESFRLK